MGDLDLLKASRKEVASTYKRNPKSKLRFDLFIEWDNWALPLRLEFGNWGIEVQVGPFIVILWVR